jgi:alkylation response protein AidB-like acyl-CoA dehydrogenase
MTMELDLGPAAKKFRDEVRGFLEAHQPEGLDGLDDEQAAFSNTPAARAWADKLAEHGFMCVSWPKEFGGRGLTGIEVAVLNEEFARMKVPRVTRGMGEWLVGPSIIVWGTDEQKAKFLPRIIDGTDRYCQGFSEPDAGSDLASLKTRGVIDGEEIVITGQKVWTSGAQMANMMFCLCRTDPDVPKHQGISYVLLPMFTEDGSSNGIELRPIKQITGGAGFTETFLTEARAPVANAIGGLNNGWKVTMTTLGNERGGNATTQHVRFTKEFWDLVTEAQKRGRADDPSLRQDLAKAFTNVEIMRYNGLRALSEVVAQKEPGPASALNKMFWSEHQRRLGEVALDVLGMDATVFESSQGDGYHPDRWQSLFLQSRSGTIWGGTAQVQRNIVGEKVLGLPKEPSVSEATKVIAK